MNPSSQLILNPPLKGSPKSRVVFLDFLRLTAILLMIQGHTFDAIYRFPSEELLSVQLYRYLHGLTAPMFYFSSGFAFFIATRKKWDSYLRFSAPLQKRLMRFVFLIALGYALHAPFFSFGRMIVEASSGRLDMMVAVDTLQLIGLTCLGLQLLVFILRTQRKFFIVATGLAVGIVLATPFLHGVDFGRILPAVVAAYFNDRYQSLFPFFNWSAFLLAGASVGYLFMEARERGNARRFMNYLALGSIGLIGGSLLLTLVPIKVFSAHDFFRANPAYFNVRLGFVSLVAVGLWHLEQLAKKPAKWISIIGAQSLAIYVGHVMVVYGSPINPGLAGLFGKVFTLPQASFSAFGLIVAMFLLGLGWHAMKYEHERPSKFLELATAVVLLFIFFINEQ